MLWPLSVRAQAGLFTTLAFLATLAWSAVWLPLSVHAAAEPDLHVTALDLSPKSARVSDSVTASVVVRNAGLVPAASTTLRLHFEPGAGAPPLVLGSAGVVTLAPGESRAFPFSFTVPAVTPGRSYQVWAQVDPDASLPETNDRNNRRQTRLLVTLPDLKLTGLTLSPTAQAGDPVTATVRVRNRGSVPANATLTTLFITTSPSASLDGLVPATTIDVPALASGEEANLTKSITLPMLAPGKYHLVAMADSGAVQAETNETNNRRSARFEVAAPVVSIETLEVVPTVVLPGQTATAGLRISNGGRVTTHPTTADVFLATEESAPLGSGLSVTRLAVAAIKPGEVAYHTAPITVPSANPGAYYVIAQVDTSQAIGMALMAASTTTPSTGGKWIRKSVKLQVAVPDLTVAPITATPTSVRPGATVFTTGTVLNPTAYPVPTTTLRVWLTANPSSLPTSNGSGAVLLGSSSIPSLAAGVQTTFAVSLTIPSNAQTGVQHIQAMADADSAVAESDESNNLVHTSITIQAPEPTPSGPVYYVAQTGHDANPGTEAQPFRTVRRGVQALRAGATLYVKSGTYAEHLDRIPGGTSWSAPVRVVAYPGDTVVLRPSGVARVLHFQDSTTAYISVEGFVLDADYVSLDAVKITYGSDPANAAHHIRLLRCEIKNAAGNGVLVTHGANDNEFIELDVHHNGINEYTHGFYIASSGNRVENSTIYQNGGTGVHLYASNSLTVNDNVVHGNWITSNARAGSWGPGIIVSRGARNRVYNNVVVANVRGIQVDYSAAETDVYNNTIYANTREGIFIGTGSADADVRNNIIYGNSGVNYSEDGTRTTHSHNLIGVNPGFVNAPAGDYRLRADSPAVNAGMILTPLVTTDLEGTSRPQHGAFDIGAFELR